jgi:hypothetical protein
MLEHGLPCRLCHNQLDSMESMRTNLWQCSKQPQSHCVKPSHWIWQLCGNFD